MPNQDLIRSLEELTRRHLRLLAGLLLLSMAGVLAYTLATGGPLFSEVATAALGVASALVVWIGKPPAR